MGYGCSRIVIERNQNGFEVTVTDPKIAAANEARSGKDGAIAPWRDPSVEYQFTTKQQVMDFVEAAFDKALPEEEYSTTFDKLAKDAMKS